MAQIISNKSAQGFTSVLSATDTPIQTQSRSDSVTLVKRKVIYNGIRWRRWRFGNWR